MQEPGYQHEYSNLATPLYTAGAQGGTAIHLGLSHLIAGVVALGLSAWLTHLHISLFSAGLVALAAAALCGFLCTLNLQYSLYLLELTLSRLAHGQLHSAWDESNDIPSFALRWPLGPLFLRAQEIEQRTRRYRANELLVPATLGVLYLINLAGPLGTTPGRWLIIGIPICLFGLIMVSLWRYAREMERAFGLLSAQEMGNELAKREQAFTRSLIIWAIASIACLVFNHALFVFPPVTPAQQNAYGAVLALLLLGMSHVSSYRNIRRWKQRLRQCTNDQPTRAKGA